jgi:hypothetical protein
MRAGSFEITAAQRDLGQLDVELRSSSPRHRKADRWAGASIRHQQLSRVSKVRKLASRRSGVA